jgi:hypothetical protein
MVRFSNSERHHQALDYRTSTQAVEEGRNQVHHPKVRVTPKRVLA